MRKISLHWQIIICMVLGALSGLYFNNVGFENSSLYSMILLLGDIFIRLLKNLIA